MKIFRSVTSQCSVCSGTYGVDTLQIAWDENGDPLLVLAENWLCDPTEMYKEAVSLGKDKWPPAGIHPDNKYDGNDPIEAKLRGNGWHPLWLCVQLILTSP